MRYRMIGIDLDGTLLNSQGKVSDENRAAVAAARAAGVIVVPCTGRAWRESAGPLAGVDLGDGQGGAPGVFVTGAVIADVRTGRALELAVMEPGLALELVGRFRDLPEAVLVFQDAQQAGHDYLVTGGGVLTPNTQWWFQSTGSVVKFLKHPGPADLHHTLRVGVVGEAARMTRLVQAIGQDLAGGVVVQSFEAVQENSAALPVHVLEVFAAGVDKWRGLRFLAERYHIEPAQIAVIGDQVNDLTMLAAAGCGIAMGNAVPAVRQIVRRHTLDCDHAGVAHAIRQMLAGVW